MLLTSACSSLAILEKKLFERRSKLQKNFFKFATWQIKTGKIIKEKKLTISNRHYSWKVNLTKLVLSFLLFLSFPWPKTKRCTQQVNVQSNKYGFFILLTKQKCRHWREMSIFSTPSSVIGCVLSKYRQNLDRQNPSKRYHRANTKFTIEKQLIKGFSSSERPNVFWRFNVQIKHRISSHDWS